MAEKREPTILIVDDEQDISDLLATVLKREGFCNIYTASSAQKGREAFNRYKPDLVLLDIMLPDGDGHTLIKEFLSIKQIPILFISAKNDEVDRILGFALGADDYITKPFSPREVAYRVKARLKFNPLESVEPIENSKNNQICFGEICLFPDAGEVIKNDVLLDFTAKEFKLLLFLSQNPNRILSKELICQEVWGEDFFGFDNTISVHVRKIRLKIEKDPSKPEWIQTVIGLGYKFVIKQEKL